jgi:hypothetical protein
MLVEDPIDILVARVRLRFEQRRGGEEHARLAVAALRDILIYPCLLQRVTPISCEAFDRRELFARGVRGCDLTGSHRCGALKNCARAADTNAAAVFRAGQAEDVSQNPEQRCVALNIHGATASVYNY